MAEIVSADNEKGGVGKTTTNACFGEYVGVIKKEPTLLIGMDPQLNLEACYLDIKKNPISGRKEPPPHPMYDPNKPEFKDWNGKSSISDIFFGDGPVMPYPTRYENIDILPANAHKLKQLDSLREPNLINRITQQLRIFLSQNNIQNAYKLIIIDPPPTQGVLMEATLKTITHLVIPLELEEKSMEGLDGMMQLWYQESIARAAYKPLNLIGILPNKKHRRNIDNDLLADIKNSDKFKKYFLDVEIGDRKEFPESDLRKKSIFEYPDTSKAKQEMLRACELIYQEIFK